MALRCRPAAPTALLTALVAGAGAPSVGAAVTFDAAVQPDAISFPGTRELSYRLRMTTGPRAARFRVRVKQPGWDTVSARGPDGFPVVPDCFRRPLVLQGPGRLADKVCAPRPARGSMCKRGSDFWELRGEVTLPRHTTSTLVARFLTSGPPLRRTDYRAVFVAGGGDGTLRRKRRIRPSAPTVRGPFGVNVRLSTRPGTPYFPGRRRFEPGQAIDIRGRTERALRGETILLRYTYLPARGGSRQRTFARVPIDRRGRFRYRWRPRASGAYRLYAVYRARSRSRVSDQSCSRGLTVRA